MRNMHKIHYYFACLICISFLLPLSAQPDINNAVHRTFTLEEVIGLAQEQSTDAMVVKHQFLAAYWQYRSFQSERLPSLNLNMTIPNFTHAMSLVQNYETGEYNYVEDYSMRNSAGLSVRQNIVATGGTIEMSSSLERLDQFAPVAYTRYNVRPVSVTYRQPLFGTLNRLKWDKKIEPERYEEAKFVYLEAIEDIARKAVTLFFSMTLMEQRASLALQNYTHTETAFRIAQERFRIGSITQNDLLQLELRFTNAGLEVNKSQIDLNLAEFRLRSFLGFNETVKLSLIIPDNIRDLELEFSKVYELSVTNTSFERHHKIRLLEAERGVAQARANRGVSADIFAQVGLNQTGSRLGDSYRRPQDQENVRIGLSMPILDWGVGRGRVKMAQSLQEVISTQIDQELTEHRQEVLLNVLEFNNQRHQCALSARGDTIARNRYDLSMQKFAAGTLSVLELNTAQTERDEAQNRYMNELYNYWASYYEIRRLTLYDFIRRTNLSTDFDKLVQE